VNQNLNTFTKQNCCVMVFLDNGCLHPGIHEMTWDEFCANFNFSPKRKWLLEGLEEAIIDLKRCGCSVIYIDGSFVTNKLEPGDFDACWGCEVDQNIIVQNMNNLAPVLLQLSPPRTFQKYKYRGEILPSLAYADSKGLITYINFFQQVKNSKEKKGIVSIKL
jgi:hypothetical protein